jgi:hypothetical protein
MLAPAQCAGEAVGSPELSALPDRSTATQSDSDAHETALGVPAPSVALTDQLSAGAAAACRGTRTAAATQRSASMHARAKCPRSGRLAGTKRAPGAPLVR